MKTDGRAEGTENLEKDKQGQFCDTRQSIELCQMGGIFADDRVRKNDSGECFSSWLETSCCDSGTTVV